ncbi:hypothetical protein ABZ553_07810 [Streptomyces sparsogenes]|uniref:hypothetical protein n=1 Tax=Streptomyces sparsogenes TaxID=67365 RepID=UPI0033F2D2C6
MPHLPPEHRPVLEHARKLYLACHYQDEVWSEELRARVRPLVDDGLARIDRLR